MNDCIHICLANALCFEMQLFLYIHSTNIERYLLVCFKYVNHNVLGCVTIMAAAFLYLMSVNDLINNTAIACEKEAINLDVILDATPTCSCHAKRITTKFNSSCNNLLPVLRSNHVSMRNKFILTKTLAIDSIIYCSYMGFPSRDSP